jgi:hypothetical protein
VFQSKIVWKSFDDRYLSDIALNYAFTKEAEQLMREPPREPPAATTGGEEDCHKTLRLHGLLSRAQFQCRFSDYSAIMMGAARRCFAAVGASAAESDITAGMKLFDRNEREQGHAVECRVSGDRR